MSTQQMKALDPNARLTFLERFAYGLGDYSCNLVYFAISAFLLVYYTDVLGVAATTAGGVMAVSKIFDGASDLIMGRIVDNTKSKWGKARPWILRMSIPPGGVYRTDVFRPRQPHWGHADRLYLPQL